MKYIRPSNTCLDFPQGQVGLEGVTVAFLVGLVSSGSHGLPPGHSSHLRSAIAFVGTWDTNLDLHTNFRETRDIKNGRGKIMVERKLRGQQF